MRFRRPVSGHPLGDATNSHDPRPASRSKEPRKPMIILGVILLVAGFLFNISILWTIGIVLVVIGAVLAILGGTGRKVGGRAHWF